ncbi:hypothetical protein Fmac_017487 [Flemingia macrophylla]|uniref:Calmodulin-binding domain-containing protein n=1 Tax=Flemingia macrophylla TaxID=520843 RepID=A0ABD1M296_9FABA
MAKESVGTPLIPEVTTTSGVELRRHSAEIGNKEKVVVPHYLRTSTGSCHDICKYGRRQEAREDLSLIKRAGRISLCQSSEDIFGGIMTSVSKQRASFDSKPTKRSTVRHSKSVDSELRISDIFDTNKLEFPTKSSGSSENQIGNKVIVNTNKASLVRVIPSSFHPKSHVSSISETKRGIISSSFKVETSPNATSEKVKNHPKSISQMVKTSSESVSKIKRTSSKVSSFEDTGMELSNKHATSLGPDLSTSTMGTIASMKSSKGIGGQTDTKTKMKKREASSKPSRGIVASVSARKHKGLKIVPRFMNQLKVTKLELEEHNSEAQEKTLYVIKMERPNQASQSDKNESQDIELSLSNSLSSPKFSSSQSLSQQDQVEPEHATKEFENSSSSGNQEIEYKDNVDTLEAEENGMPQKDEIVCSEDKDCQKLKGEFAEFQIERVDLKSLKFQSGKVLEDNVTAAITDPEKVVLRHQDGQVKKDRQRLYNYVIEETASKLVEIQKSKVKALVGAFETVISLEEKKTCANFVN